MNEPERWTTSADAPGDLGSLLRAARGERPPADVVSRLGSQLTGPRASAGVLGGAKVIVLTLAVGAVVLGGGVWLASRPHASAPTQKEAPVQASPAPTPVTAAPPPQAVEQQNPETAAPPAPTPAPSAPAELALLRKARSAVTTDPALALRYVEQHRQLFPRGKLAEEREVIAIAALTKLGRTQDAKSRAATFAAEHPVSPHKSRVQRESRSPE